MLISQLITKKELNEGTIEEVAESFNQQILDYFSKLNFQIFYEESKVGDKLDDRLLKELIDNISNRIGCEVEVDLKIGTANNELKRILTDTEDKTTFKIQLLNEVLNKFLQLHLIVDLYEKEYALEYLSQFSTYIVYSILFNAGFDVSIFKRRFKDVKNYLVLIHKFLRYETTFLLFDLLKTLKRSRGEYKEITIEDLKKGIYYVVPNSRKKLSSEEFSDFRTELNKIKAEFNSDAIFELKIGFKDEIYLCKSPPRNHYSLERDEISSESLKDVFIFLKDYIEDLDVIFESYVYLQSRKVLTNLGIDCLFAHNLQVDGQELDILLLIPQARSLILVEVSIKEDELRKKISKMRGVMDQIERSGLKCLGFICLLSDQEPMIKNGFVLVGAKNFCKCFNDSIKSFLFKN